jgi:hypothetical protein
VQGFGGDQADVHTEYGQGGQASEAFHRLSLNISCGGNATGRGVQDGVLRELGAVLGPASAVGFYSSLDPGDAVAIFVIRTPGTAVERTHDDDAAIGQPFGYLQAAAITGNGHVNL